MCLAIFSWLAMSTSAKGSRECLSNVPLWQVFWERCKQIWFSRRSTLEGCLFPFSVSILWALNYMICWKLYPKTLNAAICRKWKPRHTGWLIEAYRHFTCKGRRGDPIVAKSRVHGDGGADNIASLQGNRVSHLSFFLRAGVGTTQAKKWHKLMSRARNFRYVRINA